MHYRIKKIDYWAVSTELQRQGEVILGGEVVKHYLPQWSRDGNLWHNYADLGFCRDGFETPESAEAFLARKSPRYREHFQGIVTEKREEQTHGSSGQTPSIM